MSTNLQIVWFKRDLRVADHAALAAAAERGPVLPLYIVEPELWRQPDASGRHWRFARASLDELSERDVAREIKALEKRMLEHARNLEFEQAARVRDQLNHLKARVFGASGADHAA